MLVFNMFKIDRKKIVAAHKAGVNTKGDGVFLSCCAKVAKKYSLILILWRVNGYNLLLASKTSRINWYDGHA